MATNNIVKCIECKDVYYDSKKLDSYAGFVPGEGDYFNTTCPECGASNTMNEEYVGIPDEELEKHLNKNISYQEMMKQKDSELAKKEKKQAYRP